MKILHIIDSLGLGGAQTIVKEILEEEKDNKDIFLFSLRKKKINIDIDNKNVFLYNSNSKYSLKPLINLKKIIQREDIKILHCHLFRSTIFGYILKKIYFPKIKLIIHEHGQIFENNFIYNFFIKLIEKKVDLFIAVSNTTKEKLIKNKIKEDKIKVLKNFIGLKRFKNKDKDFDILKEKERLNFEKDTFIVGFAGRLIKRKGWKEFIESANLLNKDFLNIEFVIAGDGKDKKRLLNLIKKYKLDNKVKYIGYVSNMELFYPLIDCLVVPSYFEPGNLILQEAYYMEKPIILSNTYSFNEEAIDNENALFFKNKDFKDLAKKIKILYENKKLREQIIKGGVKKNNSYEKDYYINSLEKIYNNILNEK